MTTLSYDAVIVNGMLHTDYSVRQKTSEERHTIQVAKRIPDRQHI